LVGFEKEKEALDKLGVSVIGISVDPLEDAQKVADEVSFPVVYGATKAHADAIGAWWGEPRNIFQASEFIVRGDGEILHSSYSSGPLARTDAADVIRWLTRREERGL
jgi:peroxiredoxin